MTYSTYFFQKAGLPTYQSFNMTIVQYAIAFFGIIGSWSFMLWLAAGPCTVSAWPYSRRYSS